MSEEPTPLPLWVEGTTRALHDVVTSALGQESYEIAPIEDPASLAFDSGGYIALITGHELVQVGFGTSALGCLGLARMLLMLEDDEPDPDQVETHDAMGELVNILAGALKSQLMDNMGLPEMHLGLPFFVYGRLVPVGNMTEQYLTVKTDSASCVVHVLRRETPGGTHLTAAA